LLTLPTATSVMETLLSAEQTKVKRQKGKKVKDKYTFSYPNFIF